MEKLLIAFILFLGLDYQFLEISSDKDMRIVVLLMLVSISAAIASSFFFFCKKRNVSSYFSFLNLIGVIASTTFATLNFTFISSLFIILSLTIVVFSIIIMIGALNELKKSFSVFSILYYLLALAYFFMVYKF